MTRPYELSGATAVVIGAGSGIGRASALSFAVRGARVVVADLREERAAAVALAIRASGGEACALGADASQEADLVALREAGLSRYGRVDVVMNNVGVVVMGVPETLPDEAWQRAWEINVMSFARSNRVFLPLLIEQGRGHVVNTASASGLLGYGFDRLPYVASKHAIVGMTEALALYLRPKGIGVTCLCPSGVRTNLVDDLRSYGGLSQKKRAPKHALSDPAEVGERVARAVTCGQFLVTTAAELSAELIARATDFDGYLRTQLEELSKE